MKKIMLVALVHVLFIAGCTDKSAESVNYEETISSSPTTEAIEQSGQLWGIEQVSLNQDGSVTLVDADPKGSGSGRGLMMYDPVNGVIDSIDLYVGQGCHLTDGDHASITYELKEIQGNRLSFTVIDKFNARAFGGNIQICTKKIVIEPYEKTTGL